MARQVAVPADALAGGLLDRVDYGDAFVVDIAPDVLAHFTADACTEMAMGRAPAALRAVVRMAHRWVLGLRLADTGCPVPGWRLLRDEPTEAVYGVEGGLITPRLVVTTASGRITLVTVVRFDRPAARAVWAAVGPVHRLVAKTLLDRGVRLATASVRPVSRPPRGQ